MNLVLLFPSDFVSKDKVRLTGRRQEHLTSILKVKTGDTLTVGLLNEKIGQGRVLETGQDILMQVDLSQSPPKPLPLTLILALPRPQMLRRCLQTAASLGIKKIILLNFNRVEKSLWSSSALKPEAIQEQLVLGLEQAKDTRLPQVIFKKGFKPFVEKDLAGLATGTLKLVAHPGGGKTCPTHPKKPITLAIGPEGGIIDYELQKLADVGFAPVDLGPRVLKVETALPYIIGRLFCP